MLVKAQWIKLKFDGGPCLPHLWSWPVKLRVDINKWITGIFRTWNEDLVNCVLRHENVADILNVVRIPAQIFKLFIFNTDLVYIYKRELSHHIYKSQTYMPHNTSYHKVPHAIQNVQKPKPHLHRSRHLNRPQNKSHQVITNTYRAWITPRFTHTKARSLQALQRNISSQEFISARNWIGRHSVQTVLTCYTRILWCELAGFIFSFSLLLPWKI